MTYEKTPNQGPFDDEPKRSWGVLCRYIETGDDSYPLRHVDVYANGYALRYDRSHWCDEFGMLADMRREAAKKWEHLFGPTITIDAAEFEAVWQAACTSPTWSEQVGSAQMAKLGAVPIWLKLRGLA